MSYSNWSVLTASFVVVTYLALSGVALCAVLYLVGARWRHQIRHLAVSLFALFPLAFVLLLILLAGGEYTFPWIGHVSHGEEVHMPGWYTLPWLAARETLGMLTVIGVWWIFIKRQEVSDRSEQDRDKFHHVACWVPFFTVLYATMVAWDFEMTLRPAWHSAIFGMQNLVSNFGMFLSFLLIWIYVLNTRDKLVKKVEEYIYNYLAQMMLAFTLLWMYTFFAQYLTIWYGNLADERDRIDAMQNGDYTVLWWSMVALKFVIPFVTLCFPVTRHNPQATVAVAVCIITGTLFERYIWVAGINGTGTIPLVMAIVVGAVLATAGFLLVRGTMRRNQLIKG
jgi:Ni/Fe-hydrogenase subunit HybB-like protein